MTLNLMGGKSEIWVFVVGATREMLQRPTGQLNGGVWFS